MRQTREVKSGRKSKTTADLKEEALPQEKGPIRVLASDTLLLSCYTAH